VFFRQAKNNTVFYRLSALINSSIFAAMTLMQFCKSSTVAGFGT
jgi:hypothetical protein